MKKIIYTVFIAIFLQGCAPSDLPTCFKNAGTISKEEVELPPFNEIIIYKRVKLFIEQGPVQKVVVETGEHLRSDVNLEVVNDRLGIRNENSCNLFRDYEITKIYVTIPNLTWLQNSSGYSIESIGTLKLDNLWLVSENQAEDPKINTDGDFILDLDVQKLRITNDDVSNYFLTGKAESANVFFAAGDGRLDAPNFEVQDYNIFHRGTNKMILNPRQKIHGEIRSSGNVIGVNKPPVVNVKEFYTGRLIFEAPAP